MLCIVACAGSPRAYNTPDRFHQEEDGAEPRSRQTVLQQHVVCFDYVSTCTHRRDQPQQQHCWQQQQHR
jgi:hypothetical protein